MAHAVQTLATQVAQVQTEARRQVAHAQADAQRHLAAGRTSGAFQQKPTVSSCKKTRRWPMNLILISCMGFLVDFRPKMAF